MHRLALGHHRVEEVFQGVSLRGPTQRVRAGRGLPEIEMPAEQLVVRRSPVGGRVPAAASGDPRQQQDHQQTEQRMFDRAGAIVPEGSVGMADIRKHAASRLRVKAVKDETWSSSCAVRNTSWAGLWTRSQIIWYFITKPCARPVITIPSKCLDNRQGQIFQCTVAADFNIA